PSLYISLHLTARPSFPTRRSYDLDAAIPHDLGLIDVESSHASIRQDTAPESSPAQVERRDCCRGQREPTRVTRIDYRFDLLLTPDRKSTRLNSSHEWISYAVFCLK